MSTSADRGGGGKDREAAGSGARGPGARPGAQPGVRPGAQPGAQIGREVVLHVATLARIALREEEVPRLAEELQQIVSFFESLDEVDTEGVVETASVQLQRMPLRPDRPVASLDRETVLHEAPRVIGEGFAVPGFVDE